MIRQRAVAAALVVPLALAGCTSSGKKHTSAGSSSTAASSTSGAEASLASSLHAALVKLTSTAMTIDAGGLIAATSGHIALSNGTATASDITIGSGSGATRVITIGNTAYAKLPAGQNTSGKPYVKVSANSTNEFVRGLSANLEIIQAAASLGDLANVLRTASGFTDKGSEQVNGTAAHHYSFSVTGDAHGSTLERQLAELGSAPVPVDLWVNAEHLPIKVVLTVKLGGASLPVTATLSDFNAPVTITAPPANEVAGG